MYNFNQKLNLLLHIRNKLEEKYNMTGKCLNMSFNSWIIHKHGVFNRPLLFFIADSDLKYYKECKTAFSNLVSYFQL